MKPPSVASSGPETPKPPPRPVSAAWLERAALDYLQRYSASTEMLRRTLSRRVEKRARARGEEPAAFAEMIEATVARALSAGLVDDARFAEGRLAALRRLGTSRRGAGFKLAAKGVPREVVAAVMEAEREASPEEDSEEKAAWAYAKRRRLGPFRQPDRRADYRERDLGSLARQGFPYGLARRIIDADEEPA
ncbi:regulatory protein RecX [Methylobacterium sp. SD21]|uniref:regulatory protein RecX n=1 Tax=Methylobacterium litchii TaxID=3138810 RepID=UPI00313F3302